MRRRSSGCGACGRAAASRSPRPTSSRRGCCRRVRCSPNPHGTAPGWWVDRPDGRVIVTLPGPAARDAADVGERGPAAARREGRGPRERGPDAAPDRHRRVAGRGAARRAAAPGHQPDRRHLRAPGGGGRPDLRPCRGRRDGGRARRRGGDRRARPRWTSSSGRRGDTTWAGALAEALDARGWTLATVESGTVRRAGRAASGRGGRASVRGPLAANRRRPTGTRPATWRTPSAPARRQAPTSGWRVRASAAGNDTAVHVAVVTPDRRHAERRLVFLRGSVGADRSAIAGAAVLLAVLRGRRRRGADGADGAAPAS